MAIKRTNEKIMNKKTIHLYPTLRCNGGCSYCSNISPIQKGIYSYQERLSGHWIKLIKELAEFDVYLTGGEVFLFHGIVDILSGIFDHLDRIIVYTNGVLISDEFIRKIDPAKVMFRCSYHTCLGSIEEFMEKINILEKKGISFKIFMVDSSEEDALAMRIGFFRDKGYDIGVDYDQRRHLHKKGRVKCFLPTKIVSPEGIVFHCVSRMIRHKEEEENLFEGQEIKDVESTLCDEPQACTPCDLAASYQEVIT
ncbi:MAG: radical SAM protein [Desulfobacterales bacterium]|nr:radical SAM protein [Desulfobacterales bacterium]